MGVYEKRLYKRVNENSFVRCFLSTCPNCEKQLWSLKEEFDTENGVIKAMFICNCGKKFKKIALDRDKKAGYKLPQSLVKELKTQKYGTQKVLTHKKKQYLVLPDKILTRTEKE